jgi:dGTPase
MRAVLTVPVGEQVQRLRGRLVNEQAPRWRDEAERDRDRLLYSSALQRLGGITQVTAAEPGHAFHTRLTHTLKVAQVARALARRFKKLADRGELVGTAARVAGSLDFHAAEAAALGHDLGHPPFGHIAEQELDKKAEPAGGFEGNAQSFRILTRLAARATHPPGLNLTRETLNGTLKYPWTRGGADSHGKWSVYPDDEEAFRWVREDSVADEPSLVARIMDWADDLTYAVHDLDDFYRAGLVPLDRLAAGGREVDTFRERLVPTRRARDEADADAVVTALTNALQLFRIREPYSGYIDQRVALRAAASRLIGAYVEALSLRDGGIPNQAILEIDEELERQVHALKSVTWVYVVMRPSLAVIQKGQRRVISDLHDWYVEATGRRGDRRLLPPAYQHRLSAEPTDEERCRLVTDLVASLSEPAAIELHQRMSGLSPGSIVDTAAHLV